MTGNGTDTDLVLNLARNSPWLNEEGKNLYPEVIRGDANEILSEIRDNHLTIVTEKGQVYEQHQPLDISNGKIQIEKPLGWHETTELFYFFFQNRYSAWNYFPVINMVSHPSALQINLPDKVYYLQKRRYTRKTTPIGTRALFKGNDNHMDSAHVKDLSEGGMLIFHNSGKDKYPLDSIINEIFITIPPDQTSGDRRITPLINRGEVVRTFYDHEQGISYYGTRFFYKSAYVREKVRDLVTCLESPSG
ncbi:MAG: PilZ domain-containing protein [Thermodesulfobacteriota bacterium]